VRYFNVVRFAIVVLPLLGSDVNMIRSGESPGLIGTRVSWGIVVSATGPDILNGALIDGGNFTIHQETVLEDGPLTERADHLLEPPPPTARSARASSAASGKKPATSSTRRKRAGFFIFLSQSRHSPATARAAGTLAQLL